LHETEPEKECQLRTVLIKSHGGQGYSQSDAIFWGVVIGEKTAKKRENNRGGGGVISKIRRFFDLTGFLSGFLGNFEN